MSLIASNNGGAKYEPIEEGVYLATVYSIVDLGEVYSTMFNKTARKVLMTWEIPEVTIEIEGVMKPRAISKEYTLSLNEKANLRKDLEAFRNKKFSDEELTGFDLKNVLGKSCQIQVINTDGKNGAVYSNISSIMSLPKGSKHPKPFNPTVFFDLDAPSALSEIATLPNWVQDKIRTSETYKNMTANGSDFPPVLDDSDIPF